MWGQAAAEPVVLTRALMAQRAAIGPLSAFIGISWSDAVQAAHADTVSFTSYCGGGNNRALAKAGVLDILPCHYGQLGDLIRSGQLRVDVLMLQLAPADALGRHSMSMACEYLEPAVRMARVVIAEINEQAPATAGPHALQASDIDFVVRTSRAPLAPPAVMAQPSELGVARHVASLIGDGATLQYGIGALPEAIVAQLSDRRDLGLHSGAIGDAAAALIRSGVITNARKPVDRGISVTGMLMGSEALNRLAHCNPQLALRSVDYTHAPAVLAGMDGLVTLNSAVEVDLTGQVNAEVAGGIYVGAVGGAMDFMRGARLARNGLPVIALPSRIEGKNISRIVSSLNGPVSTPRSDGVVIVTEHGIADLRGLSLAQRVPRMIAIAHPEERERLAHEARRAGLR
ncbi:MAG: acetyl-CoA hydrolase/transferase family protein [Haliea sp.]|nr:MAG: acetyl-CoA hydrolase/transferase family protein [Haliea sp.]